jgi:hypothetical protein
LRDLFVPFIKSENLLDNQSLAPTQSLKAIQSRNRLQMNYAAFAQNLSQMCILAFRNNFSKDLEKLEEH